jgi:predicted RNase H-like HicB family nuclease
MKTFQVIRSDIVFELKPETEGGYTITVPSLPGCISYSETFEKSRELTKGLWKAGWL